MPVDGLEAMNFLMELSKITSNDPASQVSMYEVGAALGMEKAEAGKVAEELIGNGLVEVKTLAGGIAITAQGLEAVHASQGNDASAGEMVLGSEPVLDEQGRQSMETLVADIARHMEKATVAYAAIEEMVMDIKTIQTQLLSPKPKTAILREVLRSLQSTLSSGGNNELSTRLQKIIES